MTSNVVTTDIAVVLQTTIDKATSQLWELDQDVRKIFLTYIYL